MLTYDRIQQRSVHNAYLSNVGIMDQLVYYRVRNFEIDLRSDDPFHPGNASDVNDWHVWHMAAERGRGKLSDYLKQFRAWHDAFPQHEVVTLTIELKGNDFASSHFAFDTHGENRTPLGLDRRFVEHIGRENFFTPADLLRRAPGARTLAEAIQRAGWPTVDELRGKFIVTIHEYNYFPGTLVGGPPRPWVQWRSQSMWQYSGFDGEHAAARIGFIAPLFLWEHDDMLDQVPWAVFHTEMKDENGKKRARDMRGNRKYQRMILRSGDSDGGSDVLRGYQSAEMNFLLTDRVDWHEHRSARFHNAHLYPFAARGLVGEDVWAVPSELSDKYEPGHLLEIDVRSGDIDGTADNFAFACVQDRTPERTELAALVSVASNKEVHRHAKGCLMARRTTDPGSPFVAIARHGDDEQPQLHWRREQGGGTSFQAAHFPYAGEGLHGEDAAFLRLVLTPTGSGGTRADALASLDGHRWHRVGDPVELPFWLGLQGIGACSNDPRFRTADGGNTRILFANPVRNGRRLYRPSFDHVLKIGNVPELVIRDYSFPRGG